MAVRNVGYVKRVEVHYSAGGAPWSVVAAGYTRMGRSYETWVAAVPETEAPFVEFAVRLCVGELDVWDNNRGANYRIDTVTAAIVGQSWDVAVIEAAEELAGSHSPYRIAAVVLDSLQPSQVFVRWTGDRWQTATTTACRQHERGEAANSTRAASVWETGIPVEGLAQLEFAVGAESSSGSTAWDNHDGANHIARGRALRVLTLNLHCFEEPDWDAKFWQIARAINDHDVDLVCLQEVAEPWNGSREDGSVNAARLIRSRLKRPYHITYDWSHLGFGRYREGSAILSRYNVTIKDSGYVSATRDPYDIHARKVVMAQVEVPGFGAVNVFSVHLSWWSDGFKTQFENLRRWADGRHTDQVAATLLCGDFNSAPDSEGYRLATTNGEYQDQFLQAVRVDAAGNGHSPGAGDGRIDYIFLKRGSALGVLNAKELFNSGDSYGRVSDHPGYLAEFELGRT